MESQFSLPPTALLSVVASLTAVFVAGIMAARRSNAAGAVAFACAALLGPLVALFGAVRLVIAAMQAIATTGSGGVGSVAAGLYEAWAPVVIASSLGCIIGVSGFVIFLVRKPNETDSGVIPAATIAGLVLIALLPPLAFTRAESTIMKTIDPNAKVEGSIAEITTTISRSLLTAAFGSAGVGLVLILAGIVLPARMTNGSARPLIALALLFVVIITASAAFAAWARAKNLQEIAMTGRVK